MAGQRLEVARCVNLPIKSHYSDSLMLCFSVFGMVYFATTQSDTYAEYLSVHQSLLTAMGFQPPNLISHEDIKQVCFFLCFNLNFEMNLLKMERYTTLFVLVSRLHQAESCHYWGVC